MNVQAATADLAQRELPYLAVIDHIDFDSLLTVWGLRYLVANGNCTLKMVNSGERLPEDEEAGYVVEYLDCSGGDCDHHGKNLERTSSFELLCKKYGLLDDLGLSVLLELSKKVDNAEEVPWDSIAWSINGLEHNRDFKDPDTKEIDYGRIFEFASVVFDQNYRQTKNRFDATQEYELLVAKKLIDVRTLPNGRTIVFLDNKPRLRNETFKRGADVVVFTEPVDRKKPFGNFHVQIAVNRDNNIDLAPLMVSIRREELNRRLGKKANLTSFAKLDMSGKHPQVPGWFMLDPQHGLHKLIVCGTHKHPLKDRDERTTLSKGAILSLGVDFVSALPPK